MAVVRDGNGFAPLADFDAAASVRVVLTDIDDTLTEGGRLPAVAYSALERLHDAGLIVVPVTGRPAGWCDLIARQWPVDGVVGENGAFYFRYDDRARRMIRSYARTLAQRAADRTLLEAIRGDVLAEIRGAAVASDQAYREADLAIDFCEDVPPLPGDDVRRIVEVFARHGATAKISSIHVNGWFGGYDKLTTSLAMLAAEFGIDGTQHEREVVFVGDSPNDVPMFAFFSNSVGVANSRDAADQLASPPRWVTTRRSAEGFAEVADHLLRGRSAHSTVALATTHV